VVAKLVETLRNLLNNDPQRLAQHTIVDDQTPEGYLLKGWKWNSGKYITNRKLREILDALAKVCCGISKRSSSNLTEARK
jgi:V-type H+-transporting ATPase subunit C